jgi:release factor H-coupled RctB family protein
MGTSVSVNAQPRVHLFASSSQWIEDAATWQLYQLASRRGATAIAGLPDLHPGRHGPVGCALLTEGIVHPDVIGTDIGCGMQLWALDMPERKVSLDKMEQRLPAIEGAWEGDARAALAARAIAAEDFAGSLGTIGGGNHFCELQAVNGIIDQEGAAKYGLESGGTAMLVHSGSRGFGAHVLQSHGQAGTEGLTLEEAKGYLSQHDSAVAFASLNREIIGRRALNAIRADGRIVSDIPHNLLEVKSRAVLHRKGAAPSDRGPVVIAGSRGALSYLVQPLVGPQEALATISHGAGRKHDRSSMEKRIRTAPGNLQRLVRTPLGSRVICTDRQLLMEEAPDAYKDVRKVVSDLEEANLVRVIAVLRPLVTFKTARDFRETKRRNWK